MLTRAPVAGPAMLTPREPAWVQILFMEEMHAKGLLYAKPSDLVCAVPNAQAAVTACERLVKENAKNCQKESSSTPASSGGGTGERRCPTWVPLVCAAAVGVAVGVAMAHRLPCMFKCIPTAVAKVVV